MYRGSGTKLPCCYHVFEGEVPTAAISQRALAEYVGAVKHVLYRDVMYS
ncbi:hypothetical protein QNH39_15195 [Neobacillus novalis]|uniref:Uncharacterized protein n=1 Tax=Neobacillus novalis TaxID=220687 RepID=A0AA95S6T9_9BACI|nr:hypothetical protein [Neobacillus novalis]WHY84030.1 hypothetical protein QNH39_15195 [Neobacillus novalis]